VSEGGILVTAATLRNLVLRLIVAGALLAFVFRTALPRDGTGIFESIVSTWQTGPALAGFWFLIAFGIFGISFAIGASRFSTLLRGAGFTLRWPTLFRAYLVAGFFNLVLPGAILGDVYRLWDVRREAGQGSRALGIIVVERLLSLSALGCLGLVAAPFIPLDTDDRFLAWMLMGLCGFIAVGTAGALHPRINGLIRRRVAPLHHVSRRLADATDGALAAVSDLAESPRILLRAFVLSLLNQGLPVAAVYCLAVPLAGTTAWYWFAIIVPFVTLASLIPISIGGTGVREYLYITLFGAVGMPKEAALALSLSLLGTAIVWALVGFAIFSLDRRSARAATEPS
jgi:uncharacterized protein (TIRG00374 family)